MTTLRPVVHPGRSISVLAAAGIVAALMQTLVVPLIGSLPTLLNTTASNASWAVTATLLAGAVTTPVSGRLGDLYGKRRILLACCVPLVVGSVVCALADSLIPMVVGRALQGVGMGIVALGISALRDIMPPERLGSSIALISSSLGIGGALGLPFAAAVAEGADWRILFWVSAALSAVVGVLIYLVIPATPAQKERTARFDLLGALGLGTGLICLLLGVSKGADWGWGSATTLVLLILSPVILLVWGWWELHTPSPLVDLRVTARPLVLVTNAASFVVAFSMYAAALLVPQLLQLPERTGYGLGQSMLAAGLWMAPSGLMMMVVSPLGAKLSTARSPKTTLFVGSLVIALGYGSSLLLMGSTWGLLIVTCVCNTGVALAYGAMPALIMGGVPQSETASANSFNTLLRSVGTSVAAAVVGIILAQMTQGAGAQPVPSESGFRTGLLLGCVVALAAAAITLAIPYRKPAANRPGTGDDATSPTGSAPVPKATAAAAAPGARPADTPATRGTSTD
ncbi:MFS transporter [Streptomyces zingiberis]|uniref:MFS transporter n=1 Tax=Streptomyces zingiberis TaxID=2053010 RepID=A0ABX1BZR6_9ACTN|nr:MFS transporter [Streptomyces zingiberis]NJQ03165.1 MFS transporter [Streptomyces zingiberis]